MIDGTAFMRMLGATPQEHVAHCVDTAYFQSNPDALSYVRAYHRGEVHPLMLAMQGGGEPECVAVAPISPRHHVRLMVWPGTLHATARIWAEQAARRERSRLGLPERR